MGRRRRHPAAPDGQRVGGLADAPTPPGAPASTAGAVGVCTVGERCAVDGVALTVRQVMAADSVEGAPAPRPGHTLLVADVTIENVGDLPIGYRPQHFRVRTADGAEHTAGAMVPDDAGDPAAPGELVLRRLVFEVPQGAAGFRLLYGPPEFQGIEIPVDLGR